MVTMTGWPWNTVRDQLDLPRVYALQAAWKDNPPLAVTMRLAAEALGGEFKGGSLLGQPGSQGPSKTEEANPHAIMAALGQGDVGTYVPPRRGMVMPEATAEPEPLP